MRVDPPQTLDSLREDGDRSGYVVLRAIPRGPGHFLLQFRGPDGGTVAGQWFSSPDRCAKVVDQTAAAARAGAVTRLGPRLVAQAQGADRRLAALHPLARREGAHLVSHRPERRATVRHEDATGAYYTKVVRPDRCHRLLSMQDELSTVVDVTVPTVVAANPSRGVITTRALAGRTLRQLAGDSTVSGQALVVGAASVGAAVRRLHESSMSSTTVHDAAAELRVTREWLGLARHHRALPLPAQPIAALLERLDQRLTAAEAVPVPVHRDLHDKQVVVDENRVAILDFDLLAAGDPALDLANLLVHLELRAHQGVMSPETMRACARAVLDGYDASPAVRAAIPAYAWCTRLRLLAVYAFRPLSTDAAVRLITHPLLEEAS